MHLSIYSKLTSYKFIVQDIIVSQEKFQKYLKSKIYIDVK